MKVNKRYKALLAMFLAAGIAGTSALSAEAATPSYNFDPPTSATKVDDNVITASVHRAASVMPEILGINTSCGFSMINGSMPTSLDEAKTKLMLGVFGTSANENPDPFYYNYFYNFYAEANGLEKTQDAVLVPEKNVAASPAQADTTIVDGYGTSISLAARPDILIGVSSKGTNDKNGYNDLIQKIRTGEIGEEYYQQGDEDYAPYLIGYSMTTTYDMVVTLNEVADTMNEITEKTGKVGRYGDPKKIADDFGDYVCGTSSYVLSQLQAKGLKKKTVAHVVAINSDGTFSLANADTQAATSNVRGVEYLSLVTNNLADILNKTVVTRDELMQADVIVTCGSTGSNGDYGAGSGITSDATNGMVRQAILNKMGLTGDNEKDGKIVITEFPDTVYGITMNSIENGMGFGYFIGYAYSDVLDINPVDMCAYFYENFYHVKDYASLKNITQNTFANVVLPVGMEKTMSSSYSDAAIAAKLAEGKSFYYANRSVFENQKNMQKVWSYDGQADVTDVQYKTVDGVDGWYYTVNGAPDLTYNGFAQNSAGWWYIENGKVDFSVNSVVEGTVNGDYGWWHVVGGQVAFDNTVAQNAGGWWKISNGKVDFSYTGLAQNENGWWRITNGMVDFGYTGLTNSEYGWWKVANGAVDFGYTGLAANEYGWWRITNGAVDFGYTGLTKADVR